jgi:hypothetical protein
VTFAPTLSLVATDAVYGPAASQSNAISCTAVSEGAPVAGVTATSGTFPYGVTAVTCAAADAAGNVGTPVTFTVRVDCLPGFSFQRGACRGALRRTRQRGGSGGGMAGRGMQARPHRAAQGVRESCPFCRTCSPPSFPRHPLPSPRPAPQTTTSVPLALAPFVTPTRIAPTTQTGRAPLLAPARPASTPRQETHASVSDLKAQGEGGGGFGGPLGRVEATLCVRLRPQTRPPPRPPNPLSDVNECAADPNFCAVHASCRNFPGYAECTCDPGYAGDGYPAAKGGAGCSGGGRREPTSRRNPRARPAPAVCSRKPLPCASLCDPPAPADVLPPRLNLTSGAAGATVAATAAPGAGGAVVAFPTLSASDNLTPAADLLGAVRCRALTGGSGGAGAWVDAVPTGATLGVPTSFPVGSSLVVCTAKDAAGNESPSVAFTVVVSCGAGYALGPGAVCTGERGCTPPPFPVPIPAQAQGSHVGPEEDAIPPNRGEWRPLHETIRRAPPRRLPTTLRTASPHHTSPPLFSPRTDAVPPSLNITGPVPVTGTIAPNQSTATFAAFPAWDVADAVDASPDVTCKASVGAGGAPVAVVPGTTPFPHGVTVVTCTAADDAGNVGPAVTFTAVMSCRAGYALGGTGVCTGGPRGAAPCPIPAPSLQPQTPLLTPGRGKRRSCRATAAPPALRQPSSPPSHPHFLLTSRRRAAHAQHHWARPRHRHHCARRLNCRCCGIPRVGYRRRRRRRAGRHLRGAPRARRRARGRHPRRHAVPLRRHRGDVRRGGRRGQRRARSVLCCGYELHSRLPLPGRQVPE